MKVFQKIFFLVGFIVCIFSFFSCTTDVKVFFRDDGSADIELDCGYGKAFSKLILTASGGDELLNPAEIKVDLEKEGFTNVSVESTGELEYKIKMTDEKCSTYLFNSGILSKSSFYPSAENLLNFYNAVDSQTQAIFDIFMAPAVTGEEMSLDSYVNLISIVYGKDAGSELKNSYVNVTICDDRNNKNSISFLMADILCGNIK